jgi:type IV pilus assembly protein PilV
MMHRPQRDTNGLQRRERQSGVMLLEALLAILIFSVGILAIVGMQAAAIQDLGEAKYRSDASFLANQVIADMWSNSDKLEDYVYAGSGAAPDVIADWVNNVEAKLPGASNFPPIIDVVEDAVTDTTTVTVTVRWQQARDSEAGIDAGARQFTTVAYISCC